MSEHFVHFSDSKAEQAFHQERELFDVSENGSKIKQFIKARRKKGNDGNVTISRIDDFAIYFASHESYSEINLKRFEENGGLL